MWRILPAPHQGFSAELQTLSLLLRFYFPLPLELPCGCLAEGGMVGLLAAELSCSLNTQSHILFLFRPGSLCAVFTLQNIFSCCKLLL